MSDHLRECDHLRAKVINQDDQVALPFGSDHLREIDHLRGLHRRDKSKVITTVEDDHTRVRESLITLADHLRNVA